MALSEDDWKEIDDRVQGAMKKELQLTMRKVLAVLDNTLKWPARTVLGAIKEGFHRAGLVGDLPTDAPDKQAKK